MLHRISTGLRLVRKTNQSSQLVRGVWSLEGNSQYRCHTTNVRKTCQGCGSALTKDASQPGYIEPVRQSTLTSAYKEKRNTEHDVYEQALGDLDPEMQALFSHEANMIDKSRGGDKKHKRSLLCTRCQSLKHHSQLPKTVDEKKVSSFDIYSKIRQDPDALVVNVIDIMDFPLSLLNLRKHIGSRPRIIHVFNRLDILYKNPIQAQTAKSNLLKMLESVLDTAERLDVRLISALKGWEINSLANSLRTRRRGTNIYCVGAANAGKSSLISNLGRRAGIRGIQSPTVSHIPGTTLASIPTSVDSFGGLLGEGTGSLIDLPGVLEPGFSSFIRPDALHESLPHKFINASPISLASGQTLILGDMIQIDNITEADSHILLTPYTHLEAHRTTRPEYVLAKTSELRIEDAPRMEVAFEHEFSTKHGASNVSDLVFRDIGFVGVALWKGTVKLRLKTPGGLHCGIRTPALIGNSYKKI